MDQENTFKFPTETIELPSKGLIYPEDNPLSSGTIEMKYMTAKEEDILSNQSYIQNGTVIDKLLKSLIVSKINYNDLIVGDKNALPKSGSILTFKLLTHGDEQKIEQEIRGLKKINKNASPDLSTRLKYMITSVNGDDDKKSVREFVDNYFLAMDTRAFRQHIKSIQPDVELNIPVTLEDGSVEDVDLPIGVTFFWPDASV
jgi:hypothetical protein